MKTLLRQISLVMSLVLLFGAVSLMSSCRKKEGGEGESKAPETTESTEPIVLSSGGKAVYRIVRPSNPTNRTLESFKSVIHYFNSDLDAGMEIGDDWLMPDVDAASLKEILVGNVDRAECRELYEEVPVFP